MYARISMLCHIAINSGGLASAAGGHLLRAIDLTTPAWPTGVSCLGNRGAAVAINATVAITKPASACTPVTFDEAWVPELYATSGVYTETRLGHLYKEIDDIPICLISRGGCPISEKLLHCADTGAKAAIFYNTAGSSGDFVVAPDTGYTTDLTVATISFGYYSLLRTAKPTRVLLETNAAVQYDVCKLQPTCLKNFLSSWTFFVPVAIMALLLLVSFFTVALMFCVGSSDGVKPRQPSANGVCGLKLCPYLPCCANMKCCNQFYNTPQEYLLPGGAFRFFLYTVRARALYTSFSSAICNAVAVQQIKRAGKGA
jgi:hypothetical protein